MMKITSRDLIPIAIFSVFALIATVFISGSSTNDEQRDVLKRTQLLVSDSNTLGFFCADNGEFSGMGELHYITVSLQQPVYHSVPECGNVTSGFIVTRDTRAQVPILTVTTGISALNAAMCTSAIQQQFKLNKIVYIGTSGWSQFVGGLDPLEGCTSLPQSSSSRTRGGNSLGSTCITNAALSYACGMCVHNNSIAHSSECSRPSCNSREAESLFGPCTFVSPSRNLQQALYSASQDFTFPVMPDRLQQLSAQYWKAQSAATNNAPTPVIPSIHQDCLEMDMQKITASGPVDYLCREYVADVLNQYKIGSSPSLTSNDVSCVGAMEGTGFLRAIYGPHPNTAPMNVGVQVAILRGASNWDTYPLIQTKWEENEVSGAAGLPASKWIQNYNYTSASEHDELTTLGYQYAILMTNSIALEFVNKNY